MLSGPSRGDQFLVRGLPEPSLNASPVLHLPFCAHKKADPQSVGGDQFVSFFKTHQQPSTGVPRSLETALP